MKPNRWLIAVIAGAQFAVPSFAADEGTNSNTDIETLKAQIHELEQKVNALEQQGPAPQSAQVQELDQKVRILERQRQLDQEASAVAAKKAPQISPGSGGFNLASADTNFSIGLHGYVQLDSRTFFASGYSPGSDGFVLRRVRPIISGTVYHDFDFLFMPEFGGSSPSIYDAHVNYHPWPELQLQAGRFKPPVGLERLQSAKYLSFNERSLATDLVPNRDLGVELHGNLFDGRVSYAAGIFNGVADLANTGNSDFDNDKEFVGRVFLEPFKKSDASVLQGLGFGVSGSYGSEFTATGLTGGYSTDGQQKFFSYTNGVTANGTHWRFSPQGYYYYGPLSLLGEYVISDQQIAKGATSADLQNSAWEISAGWILTGENATYSGVNPRHPFSFSGGGWGAWQLVARYAQLGVDKVAFPIFANPNTSASAARAWSAGINWYLNKNLRVNASFSRTTFTGGTGAGATVTKQPENVFFTRLQLAF